MSKILITGGFGHHNWGDDAQLWNNVRLLKQKGYKDLTILSCDTYIQELCQCPVITLKNFRKNPEIMQKFDLLFFSGSGTINTRDMKRAKKALHPCEIALKYNKKIILSGQGMTPLNKPDIEKYIAKILNQIDTIIIRDFELGKKELKRIGIKEEKIILGIDDAFTTPPNHNRILSRNYLPPLPKNSVAINASFYMLPRLYSIFYEVAKKLRQQGFNPIFNPYNSKDKIEIEKIAKKEFPIISFKHPSEIAEFNQQVIGSIGMRYHSTVFSLGARKPNVNIYLSEYQKLKLKAINDIHKVPRYLNGNKCTAKDILNAFHETRKEQNLYDELYNKWIPKEGLAINIIEEIK